MWKISPGLGGPARRKKNLRAQGALRIQLPQQGQIWEDLGAGLHTTQ